MMNIKINLCKKLKNNKIIIKIKKIINIFINKSLIILEIRSIKINVIMQENLEIVASNSLIKIIKDKINSNNRTTNCNQLFSDS